MLCPPDYYTADCTHWPQVDWPDWALLQGLLFRHAGDMIRDSRSFQTATTQFTMITLEWDEVAPAPWEGAAGVDHKPGSASS